MSPPSERRYADALKKPMTGRLFGIALGLALSAAGVCALAAEPPEPDPLELEDAIRLAIERPGLAQRTDAEVAASRAAADAHRTWPNPEVTYDRESIFGGGDDVEQTLKVRQAIDVSGRRGLRARAQERRAEAARLRGAATKTTVEAEAHRRFASVLYRQLRAGALKSWEGQLRAALEVAKRRESAGDASAYERMRLERELRAAGVELEAEAAERSSAWGRLQALFERPTIAGTWPRVAGPLLPPEGSGDGGRDPFEIARARPDARALSAEVEAAGFERKAGERGGRPDLAVEAGWKTVHAAGARHHGYAAGVSVSVPIFDAGETERAEADARSAGTRARSALLIRETAGEIEALRRRTRALRGAATRFRMSLEDATGSLLATAAAAYAGGELGLTELLDVHRGAVADDLRALELEQETRIEWIALREATAEGARP